MITSSPPVRHTLFRSGGNRFETAGLDWEKHVVRDQQFNRFADPACLGRPFQGEGRVDWEPKKGFRELIVEMTRAAQRVLT